jgi:fibronectin-binding autotransporter adhesin
MKIRTSIMAALLVGALGLTVQADLYWDVNDTGDGGSNSDVAIGTWGIDNFWSTDPNGASSTGAWLSDETAVFSAGNDVTGTSTVTLDGQQAVAGIRFEEGAVTITGGTDILFNNFTITLEAATGVTGTINSPLNHFEGDVNKVGAGTISLGGDSPNFASNLNINVGTVIVTSANALGDAFGFTRVADGAALEFNGAFTDNDDIRINGAGIGGTGALRHTGANTSILAGGVVVESPTARIQSDAGALRFNGGTPINIGSSTTTIGGAGNVMFYGGNALSGNGTVVKEDAGIIELGQFNLASSTPFNNNFTGKWVINSGKVVLGAPSGAGVENTFNNALGARPGALVADAITIDGGTLTNNTNGVNGNFIDNRRGIQIGPNGATLEVAQALGSTGLAMINIYSSGDNTTTGVAGGGGRITRTPGNTNAVLTKTGPGELRVQGSGIPTYDFDKLVVKEGLYRIGSVILSTVEQSTVNGFGKAPVSPIADAITLDGGFIGNTPTLTLPVNSGVTVTANGGGYFGGTLNIPSLISGPGTFTVNLGTVIATNAGNAATYTGKLNVRNGTFAINADGVLGGTPGAAVADQIQLGVTTPTATTGTLRIDASMTINANRGITLNGLGRINIPTGGNTLTYGGTIAGAGKFTKMGDGTMEVTGASSYAGGTDINGRLLVNNTTGSGTGSGAVAVKVAGALGAAGTLGGTGIIAGAVSVESGAHVAPGASTNGTGVLSAASGSFATGSILDIQIGGPTFPTDFDRFALTGAAAVSGGTILNVTVVNGFAPVAGTDYGFHVLTAGGGLTGTFATANLPTLPDHTVSLNYQSNLLEVKFTANAAPIFAGDYNDDGVVDAADYVMWRKLHDAVPPIDGLANDATPGIDTTDYDPQWTQNFGNVESGSGGGGNALGGAVPEPTTLAMLLMGVAAVAASRRSR